MISGLWSNPNYDDGKNTRKEALLNIEKLHNDAILFIYSGKDPEEEVDAKMASDPFFSAINLSDEIVEETPNP